MIQGPAVDGLVNLRELEARAEAILDPVAFAYYSSGAGDEDTLRDNEAAFGRRRLRPRVLVDVDAVDTSTTILGVPVGLPVAVAPTAQHGLAVPEGEAASHRGATAAGTLFCLSTLASRPLEEVAAAAEGPRWFQLYTHADRGITEDLVARAVASGFTAIVVTADMPVIGRRDRERRGGYTWPDGMYGNFGKYADERGAHPQFLRSAMTWTDLADLAGRVGLPVIVKGVLTGEDAELAVDHGAAAVWVSNHGGRQLDRVPASIDVLAEVVAAVDGRAEVYLDGGVRRGTDVLTALALGARAVFVGRPVLYGLALGGADGVTAVLQVLREEIEIGMALLGTPTLAELGPAHLR
jgi:isopentenyl diphosphate isomerase/L-lactate dehydrogenase-like FMN-dependent dehydrogenase